jgi:hypothetical protein
MSGWRGVAKVRIAPSAHMTSALASRSPRARTSGWPQHVDHGAEPNAAVRSSGLVQRTRPTHEDLIAPQAEKRASGERRGHLPEPRVDVCSGRDQDRHCFRSVREMARPVGHHVQQRPRHARVVAAILVAESCGGEVGMLGQQPLQRLDVAGVDRLDRSYGERLLGADRGHGGRYGWMAESSGVVFVV